LLRVGGRFALFQTLRVALADAAKRAGCTDTKPISPHLLRHYAGFRTIPGELAFGLSGGSLATFFPA